MPALAELLDPAAADRLAELRTELRQRERQGVEPVTSARGERQVREPSAAPVCGACGQRIHAAEPVTDHAEPQAAAGRPAAPAAVFRQAMTPASSPTGHGER